jgi:hypothetical protein
MSQELVIVGELPDIVEKKYQELMAESQHPSRRKALTAIRNALAHQIKSCGSFSYADVGKISEKKFKGPGSQTISNNTSSHLRQLIKAAEESGEVTQKPKKGISVSDIDFLYNEIAPIIRNVGLNKRLRLFIEELRSLRKQINIVKNDYYNNSQPINYSVSQTGLINQNENLSFSDLNNNDKIAIGKFIDGIGNSIGGYGIYENEFGALEDASENEIAPVGFLAALKKIVNEHGA